MTDIEPGRRARSMAEMGAIFARIGEADDTPQSIAAYRPRPTDIVITPFGKCGTTWLQQTFHTLRTRGDMDFRDISEVVPWIETSRMLGIDLEAPQRAEPRGFKSHLPYEMLPRGAKYVVALRDPKDAMVSMYRFMEGWFLEPGTVTLSEFAAARMSGSGPNYWSHLLSWWAQRDNPDVLMFSYERMVADPEGSIRRLAGFCGIPLDDDLLALTLERSSIGYMLEYKDRFDDYLMRQASETKGGLPPGSDSAKVRKGGVGGHKAEMAPDVAAMLDARWAEVVEPATGFADYAALEAALHR
jgi:hypothetical protein